MGVAGGVVEARMGVKERWVELEVMKGTWAKVQRGWLWWGEVGKGEADRLKNSSEDEWIGRDKEEGVWSEVRGIFSTT